MSHVLKRCDNWRTHICECVHRLTAVPVRCSKRGPGRAPATCDAMGACVSSITYMMGERIGRYTCCRHGHMPHRHNTCGCWLSEPTFIASPMVPLDNADVAVDGCWIAGVYLGVQIYNCWRCIFNACVHHSTGDHRIYRHLNRHLPLAYDMHRCYPLWSRPAPPLA